VTEFTPAQELRAAAKLMRERAEAATAGPWHPAPGNNVSDNVAAHGRLVIDGGGHAREDCKPVAYGAALTADAAHMASWHPLVALAVAEWLEATARQADSDLVVGSGKLPLACRRCSGLVYEDCCCGWEQAIAVARAYLGSKENGGG
jgi:hypothetical protein